MGLRALIVVSGIVAVAGIVSAVVLAHYGPSTTALVVATTCAPLAAALVSVVRSRRALGSMTVGVGVLVAAGGVATTVGTDALSLLRLDFPLTQVATNAGTVLAPLGVVVVGVVLVVAGLAARLGDRLLGATAAVIMVATALAYALALLGLAVQPLAYRGGYRQDGPIAVAFAVCLAGVLLAVVAARWPSVAAPADPAGTDAPTVSIAVARVSSGRSKRVLRWTVVGVVLLLGAGAGWAVHQQVGDRLDPGEMFPDPALAACVRAAVDARTGERVSERELDSVFGLTCNGDLSGRGRIMNLAGLAHLPNLTTLDLTANAVADLSGLAQAPKLTTLKLTNNAVRDLAPLARLGSLRDLGLSGNEVSDLAPLAGLTSLGSLGLAGNAVADLGPLAALTGLTELDVSHNQVTDVSALAGLTRLDRLDLAGNRVADPSPLRALPALTTLDVSGNRIGDAATVAGCPAVDELRLGGNPLTDLRPLLGMPALTGLDLSDSDPTRMTGIAELRAHGVYVGGLA